jgi:PadR family transcriptional regulator, regulatory protein PadR
MPSEENAHPDPARHSRPHDPPHPCYHVPAHAYGIANRLQQVSEDALNLNQGSIYPALVRIEQHGWTRGSWGKTKTVAKKYYTITRAGLKALNEETKRWRQMAGVVEKLLAEEQ